MANSTVVININNRYSHSDKNGFTQNNRTRFFKLCKNILGNDYENWLKHSKWEEVERFAHSAIYKKTTPLLFVKNNTALQLQVNFLLRAKTDLKKNTRKNCYEQAVASAIDAGVITADKVLDWR